MSMSAGECTLATLRLKEIENIRWILVAAYLLIPSGRLWGGGGGVQCDKFIEEELSLTQ